MLRRKQLKMMIEGTLEDDERNESLDAQTTINRTQKYGVHESAQEDVLV